MVAQLDSLILPLPMEFLRPSVAEQAIPAGYSALRAVTDREGLHYIKTPKEGEMQH